VYHIGIDIGGTNIAGCLLSPTYERILQQMVPFPGADKPLDSIDAVAELIGALLRETHLSVQEAAGIGLAVPGSIDYAKKRVIHAHNLGYHDFALVGLLQERFPGVRIEIENDANAAALAEYYCGAFAGYHTAALITLGTGVGGGLILDDKLFTGGCHNGCELGHIILVDGGEACSCGNAGCFEAYCSASAVIREGRRAAQQYPDCLIAKHVKEGETLDAKLIFDSAKAGDSAAMAVFDAFIGRLGSGVASIINMFDPEVIAIGGGMCNAGDFLFDALKRDVQPKAFYDHYGAIVPAQTGSSAGAIGAALLVEHKR
jgi:glucokinase